MKSRGRPPAERPKTIEAKARITEGEAEMLKFCCDTLGVSKSDVLRRGIKKVYDETLSKKYSSTKKK